MTRMDGKCKALEGTEGIIQLVTFIYASFCSEYRYAALA